MESLHYRLSSLCSKVGSCEQTRLLETDNSLQWMEYSSVQPLSMVNRLLPQYLQLGPSMGAMYSLQAEACSQYE